MYQIIYIDIDEEITSVIDKLRKVKTTEVFLAVPRRALILQSIMSLKLLFREAEKLKKRIVVVAQDSRERKTAEKAGIETRSSLEGLDTESEMKESVTPQIQAESSKKKEIARKSRQRKSIEEIGSNDFYDASLVNGAKNDSKLTPPALNQSKSPRRMMDEISRENRAMERNDLVKKEEGIKNESLEEAEIKGEMLKTFFREKESFGKPEEKSKPVCQNPISVSGKIGKVIIILFFSGLLAAGSSVAYLFIPKAEVKVIMKSQTTEKDLDLRGDSKVNNVDVDSLVIPAKFAEKEASYVFAYPVTGKSGFSGQKAKGMVVIYNEYSSVSQPLVATTRLETADKKIFRLVKGVVVPGISEAGGKIQPGAIEAEVIADASGEEYNIDPTTFSIPGFEGSPKFAKFSAKSTVKMLGGSAAGRGSGTASLTQTDLAMAKNKSETQAKSKIQEDLQNEMVNGEKLFDGASEKTILESVALSKAGDAIDEFQYRVKIKSRALVFSEPDIKKIFANNLQVNNGADNKSRVVLDYGAVSGDIANGTMDIKVRGKASANVELDVEKLKTDLAGKSGTEIENLIKNYPQIAEIEINVQPAFLFKKVPQMTSRIEVSVD